MSNLSGSERRKLEKLLGMSSGYVLNFSDRTFGDFFDEYRVEIDSEAYKEDGTSKAKRMRTFWSIDDNYTVGRVINGLIEYALDEQYLDNIDPSLITDCQIIAQRLLNDTSVSELDALKAINNDYDFEIVAEQIRTAIDNNQPEAGLDRLHTFVNKFIRIICKSRNIVITNDKPLHSIFGEYVKKLKADSNIDSQMTERILKSSISSPSQILCNCHLD